MDNQPGWLTSDRPAPRTKGEKRVVEAARQLFQDRADGYVNTTVQDIADAAQVSVALIYKAFENKEVGARAVVAAATFSDLFQQIAERTEQQLQEDRNPLEIIDSFIDQTSELARANSELTKALMDGVHSATLRNGSTVGPRDPRAWAPLPLPLVPVVARAQQLGLVREDVSAIDIAAVITNTVMLRVIQRDEEAATETAQFVRAVIVDGIRT